MRFIQTIAIASALLAAVGAISADTGSQPCPIGGYPSVSCPIRTDEVIRSVISSRLGRSMRPPCNAIEVYVQDGAVTLTGQVESAGSRDVATILASGVRGVTCVSNQLVVCTTGSDDLELVRTVKNALAKTMFSTQKVHVQAVEGVVRLTGMVESDYARSQAEIIAATTPGVSTVYNNLAVQEVMGTF